MRCHSFRSIRFGLFLGGIAAYHHQAADVLLQEDPQPPVALLNVLVEPLQHLSEGIGKYAQRDAARHEDHGEHAVQRDHHDDRRNEPDHGADKPRQNLRDPAGNHRGVVGQAVEPLRRVRGGDSTVLLAQDVVRHSLLEAVFDVRLRKLPQPADDGGKADLQCRQRDEEHDIAPKRAAVTPYCTVHDIPQQQSVEHAQRAAHALDQRQRQHIAFFSSGDLPEPPYRAICDAALTRNMFHGTA